MAAKAPPRTVRAILAWFALCLLLPAVLAVGFLVASNVLEVRRSKEAELLALAGSASKTVDLKVTRLATVARALASSNVVAANDWEATRAQITGLGLGEDVWVAITDQDGHRLVNTSPFAKAVSSSSNPRPNSVKVASQSNEPVVSNLFTGFATGRKVISVDQGVAGSHNGLVVTVVADPAALLPQASDLAVAKDAIITVVDRNHRVIARSRDHRRWQGAMATPPMIEAMRRHPRGVVPMRSLEGDATTVAFTASALTGWTTMVVVPRKTIVQPSLSNGIAFAVIGVALLTLGLALSHYFGTILIRDLRRLEADAAELGHGRLVAPWKSSIVNIDRVQNALSEASTELDVRAARQQLMINELNHRVKNTLATVQSLAMQTFRTPDPDAPAKFNQRLVSFAQAHDLLTQTSWEPVELGLVVQRCAQSHLDRISWSGPSVILPAQVAVALCMCLHELVTNAMKYGALSNSEGEVQIEWSLNNDETIALRWTETGGPPVEPTDRRGFGTKLIERLARAELDGQFSRNFNREGLEVTMTIALASSDRWSNSFS
jgi:two-component sensor histidine kinase